MAGHGVGDRRLGISLSGFLWTSGEADRALRVGFQNSPPYHFPDANGNPTGPAVDVVKEAARRPTFGSNGDIRPKGRSGRWLRGWWIFAIVGDLPERQSLLYVSAPRVKMAYVLLFAEPFDEQRKRYRGQNAGRVEFSLDKRIAKGKLATRA